MVNWKGCERKRSWPNLSSYPGLYLEILRKTTKTSQDNPSLELGISHIGSRDVNHLTTTFGNMIN
jgi:hypothetical protein